MTNVVRSVLWIAVPFGAVLLTASIFVMGRSMPEFDDRDPRHANMMPLVGRTISAESLIEAQSREPISDQGITIPDTVVVVLLGAVGCSSNQMQVLQHWTQHSSHPVVAIYADYLMSEAMASHESLVLRRISQAEIPFLVSSDTTLSPRAQGIRTPQVVLAESGVIVQVLTSPPVILSQIPLEHVRNGPESRSGAKSGLKMGSRSNGL